MTVPLKLDRCCICDSTEVSLVRTGLIRSHRRYYSSYCLKHVSDFYRISEDDTILTLEQAIVQVRMRRIKAKL